MMSRRRFGLMAGVLIAVGLVAAFIIPYSLGYISVQMLRFDVTAGFRRVNGSVVFFNLEFGLYSRGPLAVTVDHPKFTMSVGLLTLAIVDDPKKACSECSGYNLTFSHFVNPPDDPSDFCYVSFNSYWQNPAGSPHWTLEMEAGASAGRYQEQISRIWEGGCIWDWIS